MTITSPKRIGALALAAAFAVGACGGGATPTPAASAPASGAPATQTPSDAPSQPAGISGSINVSGSSTVEPISTGVAELFKESGNPDFNWSIVGPGTGDGFKRVLQGRDRHLRRLAQDQGRGGRGLQGRRDRVRRAADRV